ncbi:AAA-like domain-containing protein [Leptolyngbya cf. ectocarpi LEGE 11479]|uniref:AAA-like domain-containing protein n=1 Tax=Leptolyngbya cf. ectocarpi LEGE 11479 TaxID=1828722 RepID=A0A929FA34_LEPEC|nr:AAA-like domain-containing protein [Leptolyngbya ectocarpi]MBE9068182.1 AAA-like domain-containing protein [Leptolyngbya cf. ectocarpi LEGE 11479]
MAATQPNIHTYQVGGSLAPYAPCYVERRADALLVSALSRGEFCYVLNSRQMGKSSLRVRTTTRLQALGIQCGVIDLTEIGTRNLTPDQWYASLALCLVNSFNLDVELGEWWRQRLYLSPVKRLGDFVEHVLLTQVQGDIVLFIDEIDSVLSLGFSVEDFFALIRAWYNRRTESSDYQRLALALFGVATPSELIADRQRTPFNIGQAIALEGFQQHEALPLLSGLATVCSNPEAVMAQIFSWTGGHPFLSQKLCQLVWQDARGESKQKQRIGTQDLSFYGSPAELNDRLPNLQRLPSSYIDQLVQTHILTNWESQDEPEHLKTIRDYLLNNEYRAGRLLSLYQSILVKGSVILDNSPEQMELLLSGLVIKADGTLTLRNRIYETIFNSTWVAQQLDKLRPYASALKVWLKSDCRDESRLLRGQALQEALMWSSLHNLSHEDYQFLAASQTFEQQQIQQQLKAEHMQVVKAQLAAETERARETEARLAAETESAKRQRWLLVVVSVGLAVASTLGGTTFLQYQRAVESQHRAEKREVEAIVSSAEALLASSQSLAATVEATRAMRQLRELPNVGAALQFKVAQVLREAIYAGAEHNRLSGHQAGVEDVAIHPDSQIIASASTSSTIKLWQSDGTLLNTLRGHQSIVLSVDFSPNGQLIASGSYDKTVRLWTLDGTLVRTIETHGDDVTSVVFSPDSKRIASASVDSTIKIWGIDGTLIHTLKGHRQLVRKLELSPDGRYLVSASDDKTIKLWRSDGSFVRTIEEHWLGVNGVAFSPDGQVIASSSLDNIKLWTLDGSLLKTLEGGGAHVTFSPDGQVVAAVSDGAIRRWTLEGTPLPKLYTPKNHGISQIVFSPNGRFLASASSDRTVRLWQIKDTPLTFLGHPLETHQVTFSPDGKSIATAGWDHTARLWQTTGEPLQIFESPIKHMGYKGRVNGVSFSPDGQLMASSGADKTIKLWQLDGTLLKTIDIGNDNAQVYATTFSPDSQLLLSIAWGGPIQLWNTKGTLVRTLEGSEKNGGRGAFSPDGQLIAAPVGIGDVVKLWRRDGTLLQTFQGHEGWVTQVIFSPDGQHLLSTGGDKTIKIWNLDGTLVRTIEAHDDVIKALAISPDGQLIASGGRDAILKLWTWDGTLVAALPQSNLVWGIAFHPDGHQLAWTGMNSVTILNDLDLALNPDRLLSQGCRWVQDYLRTNPDLDERTRQLCTDID